MTKVKCAKCGKMVYDIRPQVEGKGVCFDCATNWFAIVKWCAEDVQQVKPNWTTERCEEWLKENESRIIDCLCEQGNEFIAILLDSLEKCEWCGKEVYYLDLEEAGGGDIIPKGIKCCPECINIPKSG